MVIKITNNNLLRDILRKQKDEQLSDYKFAKKLKISRSTWINTRLSSIPLGITILRAVARTYPGEFDEDILNFLRNTDHASDS